MSGNVMKPYDISASKKQDIKIRKFLPGGIHYNFLTNDTTPRLYFKQANGMRLIDYDNNEYLDFYGKSGAVFVGHANKHFNEILIDCIQGALGGDLTEYAYPVCLYITDYISCAEQVRFCLSGTECVQNALRIARVYTGHSTIIRFTGHYHGSAANVLAQQTTVPNGLPPLDTNTVELPWNDLHVLQQYVAAQNGNIAAIIMEPICINGGGISSTVEYLKAVRNLCNKYGILLIFDEIITGVRVGVHGIQGIVNVSPDICLLGKSIGNGVPVSVIAGSKKIMALYDQCTVVHAGTFNGYPLGMSAIYATFQILTINKSHVYEELCKMTEKLYRILMKEAERAGVPLVLQGCENCMVCNCSKDLVRNNRSWTQEIIQRNDILRKCFQKYGILLSPVSRIYPNIMLNENDLDFFQERVRPALAETYAIIKRTVGFNASKR